MAKKFVVTDENVLFDIKFSLQFPPYDTKRKFVTGYIGIIICFVAFASMFFIVNTYFQAFLPYFIGAFLALPVAVSLIYGISNKLKIKRLSLSDFNFRFETVVDRSEEQYKAPFGLHKSFVDVHNYFIHFQNAKPWHIPSETYIWCESRHMNGRQIYRSVQTGDRMLVVEDKRTGKTVMGYSLEYFDFDISYIKNLF